METALYLSGALFARPYGNITPAKVFRLSSRGCQSIQSERVEGLSVPMGLKSPKLPGFVEMVHPTQIQCKPSTFKKAGLELRVKLA